MLEWPIITLVSGEKSPRNIPPEQRTRPVNASQSRGLGSLHKRLSKSGHLTIKCLSLRADIIHNLVCQNENMLLDICCICDSDYTNAKDEVLIKSAICGRSPRTLFVVCWRHLLNIKKRDPKQV